MNRKSINYLIVLFLLIASTPIKTNATSHTRQSVKESMKSVADWQIENFTYIADGTPGELHDHGIDAWTNAVFYIGLTEWAKIADNNNYYYEWLYTIGETNKWKMPANLTHEPLYSFYHADELCIAQFYLDMYQQYHQEKMISAAIERIDKIISIPADTCMQHTHKQSWSWSDALFMAPPVFLELSLLTGDSKYLHYMDREFKRTYHHLFEQDNKLFYRDDSYLNQREANGEKIFWGRGNGWVAAGLVNILKMLPADSAYRPFYSQLFQELTTRLIELQDENGSWHASLLDPDSYPAPETSATALITYALAYGVNSGILDKNVYMPNVLKAWDSLYAAVQKDGKLGWIQPIAADPKAVTKDMTAVYGVGAYLLAGCEMYKLLDK